MQCNEHGSLVDPRSSRAEIEFSVCLHSLSLPLSHTHALSPLSHTCSLSLSLTHLLSPSLSHTSSLSPLTHILTPPSFTHSSLSHTPALSPLSPPTVLPP